jgi:putative ABC transport system permease protein
MRYADSFTFSSRALFAYRSRTLLMLLAMSIGVASVVILTSLGEGARNYIVGQFSSLGTHLLIVLPGRSETTGSLPPMLGETPRDLTLEDSLALYRSNAVHYVAPIIAGSAPVSYQQLEREVTILGSTAELYPVRKLAMSRGQFLPSGDPSRAAAVCVLGEKVKQALFGQHNAIGQWVRINDRRFRVIGVLKTQGPSLGADLKDVAIIPIAAAQSLFNTESMFRILVQAKSRELIPKAKQAITAIIRERHDNEEDITVIQQDALLKTFDRIFTALTFTVAGIAAISLGVAGVLIMNVMLIAISQRTHEIGILKALGAYQQDILQLFLIESGLLSISGAIIGLLIAYASTALIAYFLPEFPLEIPLWSPIAAVTIAMSTGLFFGFLPARRAAALDPVVALSKR